MFSRKRLRFLLCHSSRKWQSTRRDSKANRGYEPLQGQTLEARDAARSEGRLLHRSGPQARRSESSRGHVQSRRQSVAGAAAELSPVMQAYLNVMLDLAARMMGGIALSLDLPEQYFADYCSDAMATVRLLALSAAAGWRTARPKGSRRAYGFRRPHAAAAGRCRRAASVGSGFGWMDPCRSGARDLCGQSRRHDRALDQRSLSLDGASRRQRIGTRALFGAVFFTPATTRTRSNAFRPASAPAIRRNIPRLRSRRICARCTSQTYKG